MERSSRNEAGHFLPGTSGNPAGRAKMPEEVIEIKRAKSLELIKRSCELLDLPQEEVGKIHENSKGRMLDAVCASLVIGSRNGDHRLQRLLFEYIVGKPESSVILSGPDGKPIQMQSGYETYSTEQLKTLALKALATSLPDSSAVPSTTT